MYTTKSKSINHFVCHIQLNKVSITYNVIGKGWDMNTQDAMKIQPDNIIEVTLLDITYW